MTETKRPPKHPRAAIDAMLLAATFSQGFCGFLSTCHFQYSCRAVASAYARSFKPLLQVFPAMWTGNFDQQTRERQTRAVELDPRHGKGNTHRSRSPFLGSDNRIPTEVEKTREIVLRKTPPFSQFPYLGWR